MPSGVYKRVKPVWNKGMKMDENFRKKISIGKAGKKLTEEHKKNISKSNLGKVFTEETKNKIRNKLLGKKLSAEHRKNISLSHKGKLVNELNHNWAGDNVKYGALHSWVKRRLGRPTKCEHCGKDGLTGRQIQWANKDHKYKRNLDDWIRLCQGCHQKYDIKYNNYKLYGR